MVSLQVNQILAFTRTQINDIIFASNGEDSESRDIFKRQYGKDLLAFGNLESDSIENMKPHLLAITKILPDNPLRAYFEFILALCSDYSKIQKLDDITRNIDNFVAESKGSTLLNPFISFVGSMISGDAFSTTGNEKFFLATSIQTDNENEIKLDFEKHEEAMKKAAEEQNKILARAAKLHEKIWKIAERHRRAALGWAARFREEIMGYEEEMTRVLGMDGIDGIDDMIRLGGMAWMGGKEETRRAPKKAKEQERSQKRGITKDPKDREKEFIEDHNRRKEKPTHPLNDQGKIQNEETSSKSDSMIGAIEDLEDS